MTLKWLIGPDNDCLVDECVPGDGMMGQMIASELEFQGASHVQELDWLHTWLESVFYFLRTFCDNVPAAMLRYLKFRTSIPGVTDALIRTETGPRRLWLVGLPLIARSNVRYLCTAHRD